MGKPTSKPEFVSPSLILRNEWRAYISGLRTRYFNPEYIGVKKRTRRTETSQYPEERKSTETPKVVASEMGPGRALK